VKHAVELAPLGRKLELESGSSLRDVLFDHGVEFPCGGRGRCRGCRIRVLSGDVGITPEMRRALTASEIQDGWRLACHARVDGPLVLEVAQWEMDVLADGVSLPGGLREGTGVAVDIGTTTLVAQSLDLGSGQVLGVRTGLNPQCAYGADVMSRVQFALCSSELTGLIRDSVGSMVAGVSNVREVVLVGNTVMHHLFSGVSVEPLSAVPFRPSSLAETSFTPRELGWDLPPACPVRFLRCLGGFVGSDILAGIAATRLHRAKRLTALIDLGTNGEIVVGNRDGLECASTAAGPAFEAACISVGMRAATGAIAEVSTCGDGFDCQVIGGGAARGICGSGLVDAASAALDLGVLVPNGRLAGGARELKLCDTVALSQRDLRELQLAKAAIAAGLRILCARRGARVQDLDRVYLAGAFGNYVRIASAARIGLLEMDPERVEPAGNTALRGAKMSLLDSSATSGIVVEHVELAADGAFQDTFVDCLNFPEVACTVDI
jgi:uncharacterized 2Fe-2S/4Fe-4S cluster protein (DUF4445 family)